MNTPSWYQFLLLGLAAWSTFHLLAHDDILDRPRRYILRLGKEWEKKGDAVPDDYRLKWAQFLVCPYCAGWWIWLAWVALFWVVPGVALPLAVAVGGRAMVVAAQKLLIKGEDREPNPDAELVADAIAEVGDSVRAAARKQAVRRGT